jgi:peptidoglycan/LPS O-acetylase OafA/YrhL
MPTRQPAQIDALTGIRGVAAIWVALHHLQEYVPGPHSPLELPGMRQLSRDGWLAVDLFFVLSGFIMMHVHGDEFATVTFARARRFVALRFARIYPVHFVVLLMHLPLLIAAMTLGMNYSAQAFTARSFVLSLFLLNGWGFAGSEGWNVPSWSVSSEWFAYLIFPILATVVLRVRKRWVTVAASCAMLAIAPLVWGMLGRVLTGFSLGCLSYRFFRNPIGPRVAEAAADLGLVAVVCISVLSPPYFQFMMLGCFVFVIVGLSQAGGALGFVMRSRPLVYLGRISYSAYIVHALVLAIYARLVIHRFAADSGALIEFAIVLGFLAIVIGCAHLLYEYVEEPGRRWLRDLLVDRPAATRVLVMQRGGTP